jgi:hypothetical protein
MPFCEVQRTLVKSRPELWAELSDPASLAKHLGEFGEIRIARIEPETAVEWEAEDVRGVVQLKASGWGTRVTLTVVRENTAEEASAQALLPGELARTEEPQPTASPTGGELGAEAEPALPQPLAEAELEYAESLTEPNPELSAMVEPAAVTEPEPEPLEAEPLAPEILAPELLEPEPLVEPERRPGLLARLFRRRRKAQPAPEPEVLGEAVEDPAVAETPGAAEEYIAAEEHPTVEEHLTVEEPLIVEEPLTAEEPSSFEEPQPTPPERPDLAAELAQVEQAMVEQDAALLSAVLDRLGAAHHRPFSRG